MIRLFTTSFFESHEPRRREYEEALNRNLACDAIAQICVLAESSNLTNRDKLVARRVEKRPLYADYFAWINEIASPDDISIVSNADIYFDETITAVEVGLRHPSTVFALARWDADKSGGFKVRNRNDSQDSWVFRGKVRPINADFQIGVPRCDNRVAAELEKAGYRVQNPAFSIRSYHLHAGDRGGYPTGDHTGFVAPPYKYVWPHNALSPHATLIHNLRNPGQRLGWRVDSRAVSQKLKLHWLKRLVPFAGNGNPKA